MRLADKAKEQGLLPLRPPFGTQLYSVSFGTDLHDTIADVARNNAPSALLAKPYLLT